MSKGHVCPTCGKEVARLEGTAMDRQHRLLEPGPAPPRVLVSSPVIPYRPKR